MQLPHRTRTVLTQLVVEFLVLFSIAFSSDSYRLSLATSRLSLFHTNIDSRSTSNKKMLSSHQNTRFYSATSSDYRHPAAITTHYPGLPDNLEIEKLVVIHRHGDRAQISRTVGGSNRPYAKENEEVTNYWNSALPTEESLHKMQSVARHGMIKEPYQGKASEVTFESDLYSGWDKDNFPYSQLTEVGAQQLMAVGRTLRERYGHLRQTETSKNILPSSLVTATNHLFCRSTNICRTIQSLRSLLVGLFDRDITSGDYQTQTEDNLPIIYTRPRDYENIFPQVDGDCPAMSSRRAIIFPHDLAKKTIKDYDAIEERMKDVLGFEDHVNWLQVKEVLTCHYVHRIKQIPDITDDDVHKATEIAGWTWGVLYKDDLLNRFAIGRFLNDILHDVSAFIHAKHDDNNLAKDKTCFIYSGHDSTLVPVMCGLGIYDDQWPDYGSYLCWEIAKDKTSGKRMIRVVYNNWVMELNKVAGTPSPIRSEPLATIKMVPLEGSNDAGRGWYLLEDFENFVDRIRIGHDAYAVESKTHFHPAGMSDEEMKKAELEAAKEGADDLSATLSFAPPSANK